MIELGKETQKQNKIDSLIRYITPYFKVKKDGTRTAIELKYDKSILMAIEELDKLIKE